MELLLLQKQVSAFANEKGISSRAEVRSLDLVSEVGELVKEVLKGTTYGKTQFSVTEAWKTELGDVMFSLLCLANETGTNLTECLELALAKYEERFRNTGNLSS